MKTQPTIPPFPRSLLAAWMIAGALATTTLPNRADVVRLSNDAMTLGFDRARGTWVECVDRASGQNFAGTGSATSNWWRLEWEGTSPAALTPSGASAFTIEPMPTGNGGLRLAWSGFGASAPPNLRVVVTVELPGTSPSSRWHLEVEETGGRPVGRVVFPRLADLPRLEHERLVLPSWAGLLCPNPRQTLGASGGRRREVDYPGHGSLQCLAFYSDGGPGISIGCDDTAGFRKHLAAFGESDARLGLEILHLPEKSPVTAQRYQLPYAAIVGLFHGDWYDAAAEYRRWATRQTWAQSSRWKRGQVPRWLGDTGLWIWNRGRSPNVIEPALALQREAGLPVSVFWHWWHGCAYDTGFPEYLPPREGDASFVAALTNAHAHDVHALVYMNQRLWGMSTASWSRENAARFAVKGSDGSVHPEVYNTFSRLPCATMCLATEFWRKTYAGLAVEAFERLGVDGIYMDQACSSLSCFDPNHGHPVGGGTYWMAGFRALAGDIRARCPSRGGPTLAGEGCAENWLPHLDAMLALDVSRERYVAPDGWDPIPFFHAVYHGYVVFYGNYSSLTRPPYDDLWPAEFAPREPLALLDARYRRQFLLEQARSFLWGQQPTLANFRPEHLRERPDEIEYLLRLARARRQALPFLQDGTMLAPPRIDGPTEEIPISRLSIYAGQRDAVREFRKTVPLVQASAWQAPDGRRALAVASISDQPQTIAITFDPARDGLPRITRARTIVGPGAAAPRLETRGGKTVLHLELPARGIGVWELGAD